MDLSLSTETFLQDDHTWLGSQHGTEATRSITLDTSAFTEGTHYPDGYIPSGTPLGRITASGKYGPYGASPSEVQVITVDATAGNFTLTFDGEVTGNISEAATAAQVQAALEGLSNINPGDVTVAGGAGGPWTVTFGGQYEGVNVPTLVATDVNLTGGGDTAGVTVSTAGGGTASDGTEVLAGFLFAAVKPGDPTSVDVQGALLEHGVIVEDNLPIAIDDAAKADVAGRFIFR